MLLSWRSQERRDLAVTQSGFSKKILNWYKRIGIQTLEMVVPEKEIYKLKNNPGEKIFLK